MVTLSYTAVHCDTIFKMGIKATGGVSGKANMILELLQHVYFEAEGAPLHLKPDLTPLDPVSKLCLDCGPVGDLLHTTQVDCAEGQLGHGGVAIE